jgi:4-amino-4-deoxy-L-arabinose transferase-like glycosyltransferase
MGAERRWDALCVTLVAFVLVAQILWLSQHRAPMLWDDSMYASGALELYDGLDASGVTGLVTRFIHGPTGAKAPLICLLPLPFFFIFGRGSQWAFYSVELLAFAVGCLATYRLVRRLSNGFGAFIAVAFLCFTPLVAGLTRQFLVEMPLLAAVLLWHELLFRSEFLERAGQENKLGITLGLGMLLKVTFPLFILGSILAGMALHLLRRDSHAQAFWDWKRAAIALVCGVALSLPTIGVGGSTGYLIAAALIAALLYTRRYSAGRVVPGVERIAVVIGVAYLIAGLWYIPNLRQMIEFAWATSFGQMALFYDQSLLAYIAQICSFGVSNLQIILIAFAALFVVVKRHKMAPANENDNLYATSAAKYAIFLWLALPLAVFLISHDRIVRLTLPCIAAVPVIGGLLGAELRKKWPRLSTGWAAACVVLAGALFVSFSFDVGPVERVAVGPWVLWGRQLDWDQTRPNPVEWPHRTIVRTAASVLGDRADKTVFLLANQEQLNWLNLKLAAVRERLPLVFDFAGGYSSIEAAADRARNSSLLLIEDGGRRGPAFTEEQGRALTDLFRSGRLGSFEHVYQVSLPDHGNLSLYRNTGERSEHTQQGLPPCFVRFGDVISLVGLHLQRNEESLRWLAQWKVERDLDEDYAVYLHFMDGEQRIFARDHLFTIAGRGTKGLKKGAQFREEYAIPLTKDIRDLRVLRAGVYKFATLAKVPVTESSMPVLEEKNGVGLDPLAPSVVLAQ